MANGLRIVLETGANGLRIVLETGANGLRIVLETGIKQAMKTGKRDSNNQLRTGVGGFL